MIHLVNMPFASLTNPNLALGLIKAQLQEAGIESKVFNLNFDFARQIGFSGYETIALFRGVETQVGEWLFAKEAWRDSFGPSEEEFADCCERELSYIPKVRDKKSWLLKIRKEVVPTFLIQCLHRLEKADDIDIVGFSCSFFQTIAALALGRLIKEKHPQAKLVYGGACFHAEMGEELIRKVPWIDAVSTGEADDVVVPLFRALKDGHPPSGLQGILYREGKDIYLGSPRCPVSSEILERLPDPDYDDFFEDSKRIGLFQESSWRQRVRLFFESSRGCWWGQRSPCTFCGLNGEGMEYRAKSAERVYRTLENLSNRYPNELCQASDNNMSMNYFNTLLPMLKKRPLTKRMRLFYEVKTNLNRYQIKALADAGIVYLQPGIESLSTHLLKLMRKGTSALQNLFFLKCCREYEITVFWNNLIRFPGEVHEDYAEMEDLLPKIFHLNPPYGGSRKVECHRFSPYFSGQAGELENLRPLPCYFLIYPVEKINPYSIAYYFDADWKCTLGDEAYEGIIEMTQKWLNIWKKQVDLPVLKVYYLADGSAIVYDSRSSDRKEIVLDPSEARILQTIEDPVHQKDVLGYEIATKDECEDILEKFVEINLAVEENCVFLGLALRQGTRDPPLASRQGFLPQESQ
ncbi:MAG: RiPP maturation radical SAM C-methyltransferase [Methanothrix sp.]|nr:RiPP maturation radical SAM C-methyltransferase [Methanothrix sp.]